MADKPVSFDAIDRLAESATLGVSLEMLWVMAGRPAHVNPYKRPPGSWERRIEDREESGISLTEWWLSLSFDQMVAMAAEYRYRMAAAFAAEKAKHWHSVSPVADD